MKLSKKITLSCLLLSLALFFGSCNSLSNLFSQDPSGDTANKKTELEALEDVKKNYIEKLKADLQEQQKKADAEKGKCDDMTQAALKNGKNPKDAKDAPNTFIQCQNSASAETQVKETKETLAKTEQDLSQIQKQRSQLPTTSSVSTDSSWLTWLLWGLGGVAGLAVVFGGMYYLLSEKIDKAITRERRMNQQGFSRIRERPEKFNEIFKVVSSLEKTVKLQQDKIKMLESKLEENTHSYSATNKEITSDYPDEANALERKLREKDNEFKDMVDEIIQTVRLQQGKIEELEFKMKKGDERTK